MVTCHQPKRPIRDCLTRTNPAGIENAVVTIPVTRMREKRNSTVYCMERIPRTTLTIVKPLRDKQRSRKRLTMAITTTSATTEKGYVPNKEEVYALVQFSKNAMK